MHADPHAHVPHRVVWQLDLDAATPAHLAALARRIAALGTTEALVRATGGTADLAEIVRHAAATGLRVILAEPSADADLAALAAAGLAGVCVPLTNQDGDAVSLSHAAVAAAHGLGVEIATTVTRANACAFDQVAEEILAAAEEAAGASLRVWEARFAVPGRTHGPEHAPTARQCERVFEVLAEVAEDAPYAVRAVDAPHFRRYLARRRAEAAVEREPALFIDALGTIHPNESWTLRLGHVDEDALDALWRVSPTLARLRAAEGLGGKCGVCEYRKLCGGSRARAQALLGDPWAEDPACAYVPGAGA